ncbi:MAG TPA: sulfatase-like hydrolase/transferase, partial [Thermoanaerobaculia bacterium]|nr:sulfatase-like hydrolase/transferase [Thermoanaerobaculia bacterium]
RATGAWTLPTHASIFTGLYTTLHDAHHETHRLAEERVTLAEMLRPTHQTAAFSENPHIIRAKGFAQGFETFEETWRPRDPAHHLNTLTSFRTWYGTRDPSRPFFAFVNLITPHLPYDPPAEWRDRFFGVSGFSRQEVDQFTRFREAHARLYSSGALSLPQRALEILRALYLVDVAWTDSRLGEILALLRNDGSLDRTLVVILSDHGENIGEHGLMEHQLSLYETLLRVPLVMRLPGQIRAGEIRDDPVQQIDVAPTILDVAGIPKDDWPSMSGTSLLGARIPQERPVIAEYMRPLDQRGLFRKVNPSFDFDRFDRRLKSIQVGTTKLIISDRGDPELYDLAADPHETRNLIEERTEAARSLRKRLLEIVPRWGPANPAERPNLDPRAIEELRSLGYLQ